MFDFSSPIRPPHRKLLPLIVKEQTPMTQQFNTINDALKWCIDHPGQRCRDAAGREVWFNMKERSREKLVFNCNLMYGETRGDDNLPVLYTDLNHFDLTTLRPVEVEPEKPTLNNLAALENWDWFKVTLPNGATDKFMKGFRWIGGGYAALYTALSAGWPVEFGRDEA